MAQKNKITQVKQGVSVSGVNRRAAQKKKKTVIISIISAALTIAIIAVTVFLIQRNNTPDATRITNYEIQKITYGNVSTTISGSGSLTPVVKATLTLADCIEKDTSTDTNTNTDTNTDTSTDTGTATQSDNGIAGELSPTDTVPTVTVTVEEVAVSVGDTVEAGDVLASVKFDDTTVKKIVAPYDAVILEFYLYDEATVGMTDSVAMLMGTEDGYYMTVSVDENNISTIELAQKVNITIDAVTTEEPIEGAVSDISYNGSTSGSVTAYGIEVTFPYVEGTYPGMSVSAEIVIEDSGDGYLVPVDAVHTSGDKKYVYLAPDNAVIGDVFEEDELDTSELTKITVTTGMSDGSYIMIEGDGIEENTLIVVTTVTSTLTGSDSEGNNSGGMSFGGIGGGMGFGGGEPPEGFDPSQMGGMNFPSRG